MTPEAIIADDVTGAGDSGVHFALGGKRTAMLLNRSALAEVLRDHDIVSISSESRFLSPEKAAEAVRGTVEECRRAGAGIAFKKVDSTLRGNPGAEIEAVLDACGADAALVCTAMPKTGRTCRDGILLLHGTPLRETETGRDPFNPVSSSLVSEILATQTNLPIANLHLADVRAGEDSLRERVAAMVADGRRVIVADAVNDSDLAILGAMLRESVSSGDVNGQPRLLPAGAGGLAEAFVGAARPARGQEPQGRMLAVVGSLTSISLEQIACAIERGDFHILELDMVSALADLEAESNRLVTEASKTEKRHLLLKNRTLPRSNGGGISTDAGMRAAEIFGNVADAVCRAGDCSTVYATGGSTAVATAFALGLKSLTLQRECMPGVVLSTCSRPGTGLRWFISKAGGFGGPDTIAQLAAGMRS